MKLRAERPGDENAIAAVIEAAFTGHPHSDGSEVGIVEHLRAAGALTVSLVVEDDGQIVGHVAFSPVTIDGEDKGWCGLGPVSVRPDRQKSGIGGRLIREGLEHLAKSGAKGCVLLGDPGYYRRFGFENHAGLRLEGVPAEYFMAKAFEGPVPSGRVSYHEGFDAS